MNGLPEPVPVVIVTLDLLALVAMHAIIRGIPTGEVAEYGEVAEAAWKTAEAMYRARPK